MKKKALYTDQTDIVSAPTGLLWESTDTAGTDERGEEMHWCIGAFCMAWHTRGMGGTQITSRDHPPPRLAFRYLLTILTLLPYQGVRSYHGPPRAL